MIKYSIAFLLQTRTLTALIELAMRGENLCVGLWMDTFV